MVNGSDDFSGGEVTKENTVLTNILLEEAKQKRLFQIYSFYIAWIFSGLFFSSVIVFSWGIIFCPTAFSFTKEPPIVNQFLILLGILSAVGTTLAIAVIRFSFSDNKDSSEESKTIPISPATESITELLNQIIGLLKK